MEDVCTDYMGKSSTLVTYTDFLIFLLRVNIIWKSANNLTMVTSYFTFVQGRSTTVSIIVAMNDRFDKICRAN